MAGVEGGWCRRCGIVVVGTHPSSVMCHAGVLHLLLCCMPASFRPLNQTHEYRELERREWEAREETRLAAEAAEASRREAHKAAIRELSAQTQVLG